MRTSRASSFHGYIPLCTFIILFTLKRSFIVEVKPYMLCFVLDIVLAKTVEQICCILCAWINFLFQCHNFPSWKYFYRFWQKRKKKKKNPEMISINGSKTHSKAKEFVWLWENPHFCLLWNLESCLLRARSVPYWPIY